MYIISGCSIQLLWVGLEGRRGGGLIDKEPMGGGEEKYITAYRLWLFFFLALPSRSEAFIIRMDR